MPERYMGIGMTIPVLDEYGKSRKELRKIVESDKDEKRRLYL